MDVLILYRSPQHIFEFSENFETLTILMEISKEHPNGGGGKEEIIDLNELVWPKIMKIQESNRRVLEWEKLTCREETDDTITWTGEDEAPCYVPYIYE